MFITAPRLRIRRPSPTTAEFTVTTVPPPTLPLRILWSILIVLRISLAISTLLVLYLRWTQERSRYFAASTAAASATAAAAAAPHPPTLLDLLSFERTWYVFSSVFGAAFSAALGVFERSPAAALLARVASSLPPAALLPASALVFYAVSLRACAEESLLVLRGLGVQTSESPRTFLASATTRFIPTEKIQDIFVNEAFRGFEVRYYLVVVVEGEEDVVVVFPGFLPRRRIVETVWRGARECLYEGRGEDKVQVTDKVMT